MARVGVARLRGKTGVYIDGLTEAKAALDYLPEAFKEVARDTIGIGTRIMLVEAIERVPVDTGKLKDSVGRNVREDGLQASVGAGDHKAAWVEFGTEDTPAQPFLFPAYRRGARFIRKQMRTWAKDAGMKARFRQKRTKRQTKGPTDE